MVDSTILEMLSSIKWICPKYKIKNCLTLERRALIEYKNPFLISGKLQNYHDDFLKKMKNEINNNAGFSTVRVGDGEALFLLGKKVGNISKRHLTKKTSINLKNWILELKKNDQIRFSITWSLRKLWKPIFPEIRKKFIPLEVIYASIANKELLKICNNYKVGIIGPKSKLIIIKKLLAHKEYKNYLHFNKFEQYIYIPEKGACNDTDYLKKNILKQIGNNKCDIYLYGIGIAKIKIINSIKESTNVLFIDIGSALDALAGIIPKDRPFFGNWTNYKIKDYDYEGIDQLSQHISEGHMQRFKTKNDIILE